MRNETRAVVNAYFSQLAKLSGVDSAEKQFTVAPSVQQTLETKIQESSAFLSQINIVGVRELQGEKLGLGVSGPAASRTDTTQKDRAPRDISTMDADGYICRKTDFDTFLSYAKLDAWAKFPDFQQRVRDAIIQRQALDRMIIGFHGVAAANETNLSTHPLLQDVNIGWLQKIRDAADPRVLDSGKTAGKVTFGPGAGADYKNLDALVYDAVQLLDPWYREDPGLRAFVSRDLMHDKLFPLVNDSQEATEKVAADVLIGAKRLGGLQPVQVPYFPEGTVLISTFKNLSIYWQEGGRRRTVVDNAKRDRIENYESSNDAYVVEDYGLVGLVEKIEQLA
ncbi:phage major capsid protein, P2 family [Rubrivivax gelatinosus]|uniref:Phage major capsid protein, P2 family n=1 Tax=Rubrivivax gelatinosus TaxID=28068 RepID=A0ABS1DQT7_RUBGE|nr:phage major capsid protein, P2 family [Rubrivivax gelatinosus]MBK1711315.1 phage major capsid protein, P2 family [Rubrivivax gelatinosus]